MSQYYSLELYHANSCGLRCDHLWVTRDIRSHLEMFTASFINCTGTWSENLSQFVRIPGRWALQYALYTTYLIDSAVRWGVADSLGFADSLSLHYLELCQSLRSALLSVCVCIPFEIQTGEEMEKHLFKHRSDHHFSSQKVGYTHQNQAFQSATSTKLRTSKL